jgi:hypothetical protein
VENPVPPISVSSADSRTGFLEKSSLDNFGCTIFRLLARIKMRAPETAIQGQWELMIGVFVNHPRSMAYTTFRGNGEM